MKKSRKNSSSGTKMSARILALILAGLMVAGAAYYVVATVAGLI